MKTTSICSKAMAAALLLPFIAAVTAFADDAPGTPSPSPSAPSQPVPSPTMTPMPTMPGK